MFIFISRANARRAARGGARRRSHATLAPSAVPPPPGRATRARCPAVRQRLYRALAVGGGRPRRPRRAYCCGWGCSRVELFARFPGPDGRAGQADGDGAAGAPGPDPSSCIQTNSTAGASSRPAPPPVPAQPGPGMAHAVHEKEVAPAHVCPQRPKERRLAWPCLCLLWPAESTPRHACSRTAEAWPGMAWHDHGKPSSPGAPRGG